MRVGSRETIYKYLYISMIWTIMNTPFHFGRYIKHLESMSLLLGLRTWSGKPHWLWRYCPGIADAQGALGQTWAPRRVTAMDKGRTPLTVRLGCHNLTGSGTSSFQDMFQSPIYYFFWKRLQLRRKLLSPCRGSYRWIKAVAVLKLSIPTCSAGRC